MKKCLIFLTALLLLVFLAGCAKTESAQIAATTLPVYEFTVRICDGTPLSVSRLVTEEVSCLHDYSLNVRQVKAAEAADLIVISGAGLEEFLDDILINKDTIDASQTIDLIIPEDHEHEHSHEEPVESESHEGHRHEQDPHIWLSPDNAITMAENICLGLTSRYPQYADTFASNFAALLSDLTALQIYGSNELQDLSCREIITFHDGFSYLAQSFDLDRKSTRLNSSHVC